MTVQDILKVTKDKVYVMDRSRGYAFMAKFDEGRQDIAANYDRQAVFEMTVQNISIIPSGGALLLIV